MKVASRSLTVFFIVGLVLPFLFAGFSQEPEINSLLDKINQSLESFPKDQNWQAKAFSIIVNMDKNWKPKKKTEVEKIVKVQGEDRIEEILKATEIKDGKSKDVTKKQIKEARKRREKALKERAKRRAKGKSEDNGDSRELSMEEMFPFSSEKRKDFDFTLLEDTSWAGIPVYTLESKAKIRSDKFYEGKYFISQSDFHVLKAEIKPAKNPKMVKRLEMGISFQILPEGYMMIKQMRMKIHVGLVVKNIRMEVQEDYSDFKLLNESE